ncbi:MAG: outer membrane protein assembly factor BamA [Phycisphaerales bacterium]|jgi:outer membrane protein insertion porin family|nr:outer membrane protein assembly factor BamA [Phycisphaerales bacterium]
MGRIKAILSGLVGALVVAAAAHGAAPDADSLLDRPIGSIQVEGLTRVQEQKVLNNIRSRVGQPYDPETAQGDISRLTRLGDFASIDIVAELAVDGTVDLSYFFREERLLAAVSVVGNRVLADGVLLGPTGLHRGSPRDDFLIQRGIREMEEAYHAKGYYLAEVTIDDAELEERDILIFEVIEGPRVRIRAIEFVGATSFSDRELGAEIETTTWFPFLRRGAVDQEQLAADIASLHKFYHGRGWIDVRVDKEIEVSPSQREAKIVFLIEEGRQYTVEEIKVTAPGGAPLEVFSGKQLAAIMNIKVGDVFRQDLVDRSRKSIADSYGVLGYLDARVFIAPIRRGTTTELSLLVEVNEGHVANVGLVNITGNILTKDKIIRTQVGLIPGRRFDAREIEATKERIMGTGLFGDAKVSVQQPEGGDESTRDVLVEIKEKNTGSINFGVGFGSDSGVLGNISLTQNNFDLFDVPETFGEFVRGRAFRGAGQRFALNFQPGTEIFAYDVSLTEPQIFGTPYALGGSAGYFRRAYANYTEERTSAGVSLARRLGDVWYGSLRLDAASVELTDLNPFEPVDVLEDAGPETLVSLGLTLTRTTIDRMTRPTRGSRTQLTIGNWGMIGGERNFNRVSIDYTTYFALDRDFLGRVSTLRVDGQVGRLFGGSAPTYERFYLGGRTLRGFQFRQVSPKGIDAAGNVTDVPVGGDFMVFLGTQYQRPLVGEMLDGVVFIDSGTVNDDVGFDQYRLSVGIGLRVYIPQLGPTPLAFDFAFPMLKQDGDQTQLFSFSADLPF